MKKLGNRLLDAQPPAVLDRIQPHLEPVQLVDADELHEPRARAENVLFPVSGLISVVAAMNDGTLVETGVVGSEGMFSVSAILGDDASMQRAVVQLPGIILRLQTSWLRQVIAGAPALRATLLRYVQATLNSVAQSAACNRLHMPEQRCARWLLTAHDRAGRDSFPMSHEFLAMMLGVHLPGVSVAAQSLQSSGFIDYNHGTMSVLDRQGLEAASWEC